MIWEGSLSRKFLNRGRIRNQGLSESGGDLIKNKRVNCPVRSSAELFYEDHLPAARVLSVTERHDNVPGSVKLALRTVVLGGVLKDTILAPVWTKSVSPVSGEG